MSDYAFAAYNLEELGWLPENWEETVFNVAREQSAQTHLDGKSSTSREESEVELEVFVVTGEVVKEQIPWLHQLYNTRLKSLASATMGMDVSTHKDIRAGININSLRGSGARYEWHVDSNPLTGLLFASTHEKGEGGELVFRVNGDERIICPQKGVFLTFDAREAPHTVFPLLNDKTRISIPMNYYFMDSEQERPEDLDTYLYDQT